MHPYLTIVSHRGRGPLMLTGAERSKPKDNESQQGQKSPEPSCVAGRNVTRGSHHGKQRGPQVKPKNAVWPSHSAPAVCPREAKTCPHKTVYMKVYMAGSSQSSKQPEWPPPGTIPAPLCIPESGGQGPGPPPSASRWRCTHDPVWPLQAFPDRSDMGAGSQHSFYPSGSRTVRIT